VETALTWLARLAETRDGPDWQRLVDTYKPLLAAWAARAGVPPADRDDVAQDVLLVVVREIGTFEHRGPGSFRGWLRAILLNRVRARAAGRAGRERGVGGWDAAARFNELEDPASALSKQWDREHDEHVAARALARVRAACAPATWAAFQRHVLDGVPAADVARELGTTVNAVLLAKSRTLRRTREEVQGLLD
jgi:RNA polymerase sigma factor (sigma-70 family)